MAEDLVSIFSALDTKDSVLSPHEGEKTETEGTESTHSEVQEVERFFTLLLCVRLFDGFRFCR